MHKGAAQLNFDEDVCIYVCVYACICVCVGGGGIHTQS